MTARRTLVLALVVVVLVVIAGAVSYWVLSRSSSPSSPSGPTGVASCPSNPANGTSGNWTTYHQNNLRDGVESSSSIASVTARWPAPTGLDGEVYAEPLVCGDSVFVATEDDSVYALNATSGAILWHTHLGTPAPSSALACAGDINPSGITGTPVIDIATGTLYTVALLTSGSSVEHMLFGLNVVNGSIRSQVVVDPAGSTPNAEQQRGALAIANGFVYVVYGGLYGDCGSYHGWVVGAPVNGSHALISYQVPTQREGAIWGTAGMAIAPDGDLYVATGNGASNTVFDHGDSVIELSPELTELGYFAPTNWVQLNEDDADLGSVAPTYLSTGDLFQIGKGGVGYLLSGTDLGGIGGQLYNASVCGGGAYGGTAHVGLSILVPCTDGLYDVVVAGSSFSVAWQTAGFDSGSPIVTGNVAWAVNITTSVLMGFNLSNGHVLFSFPLGADDHFITPAAAPGALFVAGGADLYAFTLS